MTAANATTTRSALLTLALVAMTLAVFWPVQTFGFLDFDDDGYVTANPQVRAGLSASGARWAFGNTEAGHFHPLTWLSHQADVSAFGLDAGAHHRTTLWLHALAVALCFAALRRLLANEAQGEVTAFLAAGAFAVHPLRLESVAWVATRKDVLSGVFFFAALLAWATVTGTARRWLTLGLYLLALLAKPTVLPLPLLLLALETWPGRSTSRLGARLSAQAPLLLVMVAFAGVAVFAQRSAGAMVDLGALSVGERLSNAAVGVFAQAGHLVWPAGLSIFHPLRPLVPGLGLGAGFVLAGLALAIARGKVAAPLAFAFTWGVLLLLPVSGLVQIGGQSIADRWLYLPTAGVVMGVLGAVPSTVSARARWSVALAWLGALGLVTRVDLPDWRDSEHVFGHALAVEPENFLAHNNLGLALETRGALDEAEQHYAEAVRLNPTWPTALSNLANARARRGALAEAIPLYERALARAPDFQPAHYNLALALAMQGRLAEARPHYERALALRPDDAQAALGYGVTLVNLGEVANGVGVLQRAASSSPDSAELQAHLGRALRLAGDVAGSRERTSRALALDPTQPLALAERAMTQ
jgi:Flp pilus assembly protein TadD